MLTDLQIRNFAIIDSLHVTFGPGLTVLTGETGAGKSIIVDAVNLVLGERASADLIRTGCEEATVEAVFDLAGQPELVADLAEQGIDCDGELLVKRVVARNGRNRVFIGGGLSTLSVLADLSRRLINIYGQHESQTLLKPENHLLLLDGYAGLNERRSAFAARYAEYRQLLVARQRLEEGEQEALRRIDLLSFQSGEIGAAALQPDEEETLVQERQLLVHGEKLLAGSQNAFEQLYGADSSIIGALQEVAAAVSELGAIDAHLAPVGAVLTDAAIQLEDASAQLRDYASRVECDPVRLQAVDDRLDLIHRLKRKYGNDIPAILALKAELDRELDGLLNRERTRDDLALAVAEREEELARTGAELSRARQEAGIRLEGELARELAELAMPNARIRVALEPLAEPRSTGLDRLEFLFAPNPGEEPRPLARIASGGELSRLMLALKQVHPESDVPTLVFDEVDTGIGGAVSARVGEKLQRVAARQQVLCITHLPQVAAHADQHCRVEKRVDDGRTTTVVTPLSDAARVDEMARMLGGARITETTLEHAREMIREAQGQIS